MVRLPAIDDAELAAMLEAAWRLSTEAPKKTRPKRGKR
jgi:hypothetical protein